MIGDCETIFRHVVRRQLQQYPGQAAPIAQRCLALFCQVPLALPASSHFAGQTSHLTGTTPTAAGSHRLHNAKSIHSVTRHVSTSTRFG